MHRKKLFSTVHYFIHLNLSICLLLGYVVFMFGIELGNASKVCSAHYSSICHTISVFLASLIKESCGLVAALLQYLFLSAFCWMMCEGIMLYLMLVVVFSRFINKWWFFMILGYCKSILYDKIYFIYSLVVRHILLQWETAAFVPFKNIYKPLVTQHRLNRVYMTV